MFVSLHAGPTQDHVSISSYKTEGIDLMCMSVCVCVCVCARSVYSTNRRWSLGGPGTRASPSPLHVPQIQSQRTLVRTNSETTSEDVLLHVSGVDEVSFEILHFVIM